MYLTDNNYDKKNDIINKCLYIYIFFNKFTNFINAPAAFVRTSLFLFANSLTNLLIKLHEIALASLKTLYNIYLSLVCSMIIEYIINIYLL